MISLPAVLRLPLFTSPVWAGSMLILIGTFSLGFALISQHVFGLAPCVLCIYQRWPYGIVIALGAIALLIAKKHPKAVAIIMGVSALTFLAGGGIAFFHVGVEQGWWAGLKGCSTPNFLDQDLSLDELENLINQAPVVSCGDIPWSLFGLSMAAYNTLLSIGYAGYGLISSIMITRKSNGL